MDVGTWRSGGAGSAPNSCDPVVLGALRARLRGVILTGSLLLAMGLAVAYARDEGLNFDEFYFLGAAKNLALYGEYATSSNGEFHRFDPYLSTGPTVIGPIALAYAAWGPDYFVARLAMVGALGLLLVLMYGVTSELYGRAAGALAAGFVFGVPHLPYLGLHVLGEIPAVVLFLGALWALVCAERSRDPRARYLLAGLCLGLAALTKVVLFLGLAALAGLALLVALRDRRRAVALAGAVAVGAAVLLSWELLQFFIAGPESYLGLKRQFLDIFVGESGVRTWRTHGTGGLLDQTLQTALANLRGVEKHGGVNAIQGLTVITVVFLGIARGVRQATSEARVHLFLGLFFVAYLLWFFLAPHAPSYRLLFPAYLLFGPYVAAFVAGLEGIVTDSKRGIVR